MTEETSVKIMETVNTDRNKSFIIEAFRQTTCERVTSVQKDDGVGEAFKSSIIRMAASGLVIQAADKTAVTEKKLIAPVANFVAEQAKKEMSVALWQPVSFVFPSPRPSPSGSS